ncbi:MAG: RNA polymerase sigma factor [Prevotellaceae bacterium]|jgi:RNA polymerase sigma-70 factor (ECF subfamily)|nr:RNA polymerase sigma factor [Prevotellaceae bacterium]
MEANTFQAELMNLHPNLERFAVSLTSNSEDAKDLAQETILKALIYWEKYQNNTNLKAWAFTIMKNTFINSYRKTIKHGMVLDGSDNQYLMNNSQTWLTPESDIIQDEVYYKISKLEPEFRIPFQMHTLGYKYKEIAEKLNLKIGTVKSRIFFSRQKLIEALKDYEQSATL